MQYMNNQAQTLSNIHFDFKHNVNNILPYKISKVIYDLYHEMNNLEDKYYQKNDHLMAKVHIDTNRIDISFLKVSMENGVKIISEDKDRYGVSFDFSKNHKICTLLQTYCDGVMGRFKGGEDMNRNKSHEIMYELTKHMDQNYSHSFDFE